MIILACGDVVKQIMFNKHLDLCLGRVVLIRLGYFGVDILGNIAPYFQKG